VCVISGFHDSLNYVFTLLGCYATLIGSYESLGTDRLSRNVGNKPPVSSE